MQLVILLLLILSIFQQARGQQTISLTAFESSSCSGNGVSSCFDLSTCTYMKNEDGISVYMQLQVDPFVVNIYVDPFCAWSVGTIAPTNNDDACGADSCCSGTIEVFGSDETPPTGFFYTYRETTCAPEIPADDPYISDDTSNTGSLGSIVSHSVKKQFTNVLHDKRKEKSLGQHGNVYFDCLMFAAGILVGGVVCRYIIKKSQQAYERLPDETSGGVLAMGPKDTTTSLYQQPQNIDL